MSDINKAKVSKELEEYISNAERFEKRYNEICVDYNTELAKLSGQRAALVDLYLTDDKLNLSQEKLEYFENNPNSVLSEDAKTFLEECNKLYTDFISFIDKNYYNTKDGRITEIMDLYKKIHMPRFSIEYDKDMLGHEYGIGLTYKNNASYDNLNEMISQNDDTEHYVSTITFPAKTLDSIISDMYTADLSLDIFDQPFIMPALEVALENDTISTTLLQRNLSLPYNIAARVILQMEKAKLIGEFNSDTKKREVLISEHDFRLLKNGSRNIELNKNTKKTIADEIIELANKNKSLTDRINRQLLTVEYVKKAAAEKIYTTTNDVSSANSNKFANRIFEYINELAADCEAVTEARRLADDLYKKEIVYTNLQAERMITNSKASLEQRGDSEFDETSVISKKINGIISKLSKEYEYTKSVISPDEFKGKNQEEKQNMLNEVIDRLNVYIKQLNEVDFEAQFPPIKVKIEGESFYTYQEEGKTIAAYTCDDKIPAFKQNNPFEDTVKTIFNLCDKALYIIELLVKSINAEDKEQSKNNKQLVENCKEKWLELKKQEFEQEYADILEKTFLCPEAEAKYNRLFADIKASSMPKNINLLECCTAENTDITIGTAYINIDENGNYTKLFEEIPLLNSNSVSKGIAVRVDLNLKSCGNIVLELDSENAYNADARKFTEQLIIQYLLAFPASKLNCKLTDVHNNMDFSPFKALSKVNNSILSDGIVRDDNAFEEVIKNLEAQMYNTIDNLSVNGVNNLFEYNEAFEANAQPYHLFVAVDIPNDAREDLIQRLARIIEHGNRAGIFTILVYSNAIFQTKNGEKINEVMSNITNNSILIKQSGDNFLLNASRNKRFVPDNRFGISMLPEILQIMQNNVKTAASKVLPLETMFAYADSVTDDKSAAAVLDIPIGTCGRDIQTLRMDSKGSSPHAVVIGSTGSGKTILLHTIILSACYKYSPEELNLYLVDFKAGNEFKFYEADGVVENQIPHVKLTGLTSDVNDGIAILSNLKCELENRQEKFRDANVQNIVEYRRSGYKMPRLLVIIDEIQVLFEHDDALQMKSIDILSYLFKEGRAYGISILWASLNIPSAVGLKDRVVSQIRNKISLKLNNPEDARALDLDIKAVKALDRPEKGLAVINDERTGGASMEFRVAFAEDTFEDRRKHAKAIIDKWSHVTSQMDNEPLFIIGGGSTPSPITDRSMLAEMPSKESIVSKIKSNYNLCLGQNYITGKPFEIGIKLLSGKDNVLFAGAEVDILQNLVGYSMLSLVKEHITNADNLAEPTKIYFADGEQSDDENLYNAVRTDFPEIIELVSGNKLFENAITSIYKLYKQRREEMDNLNVLKKYSPCFFVIHSLQHYIELFEDNPMLQIGDAAPDAGDSFGAFGGASAFASAYAMGLRTTGGGASGSSIPLITAFKELLSRGGRCGIHFVISTDDPGAITEINKELYGFKYKVVTKGLRNTIVYNMLDKASVNMGNDDIAIVAVHDEHYKIRMYSYKSSNDEKWYKPLAENYRGLIGE